MKQNLITHYIEILRQKPAPIRFVLANLFIVTGLCRFLTIPRHGYRLRFHPSNLSLQFWVDPSDREDELEFFRRFPKPGDLIVDVGANIGDTVLTTAMKVGNSGQIIAVEPHPRIARYLRDNCRLNGLSNVVILENAVGERSDEIFISDSKRDDMNKVGEGEIHVSMKSLDELITGVNSIALLKIDVEGYEKRVIAGASRLLKRVLCIHFEVWPESTSTFGYKVSDLLDPLKVSGFSLYRRDGENRLCTIYQDYLPTQVKDLIAVRDPKQLVERTGWTIT